MTDHDLWLILLGAMLSDEKFRKEAASVLTAEDAPDPQTRGLRELIGAKKKAEACKALGVEVNGDKPLASLVLAKCQERALQRFVELSMRTVEFAKGLTVTEALNVLDVATSKIRAKQAAIEKARGE